MNWGYVRGSSSEWNRTAAAAIVPNRYVRYRTQVRYPPRYIVTMQAEFRTAKRATTADEVEGSGEAPCGGDQSRRPVCGAKCCG
jgi:hypothetical protein